MVRVVVGLVVVVVGASVRSAVLGAWRFARGRNLVLAGLLVPLLGLPACQRGEDEPTTATTLRSAAPGDQLRVENLTLARGDTVGFAFHPTEDPASVLIKSDDRDSLRVCAGIGAGSIAPDAAHSSWGSQWEGDLCRRFDGSRPLPLPAYSEHVSFVIQNAGGEVIDVRTVTLRYRAHDHYNVVRLPPLDPGATSAWVLQPTIEARDRGSSVGAQASWQPTAPAVLEIGFASTGEVIAETLGNGEIATVETKSTEFSRRERKDVATRISNTGTEPIKADVFF